VTESEALERIVRDVNDHLNVESTAMRMHVLSQRYGKCFKEKSLSHTLMDDPRFVVRSTYSGARLVASASYIEREIAPFVGENPRAIENWWKSQTEKYIKE
jgi:hypothetical protein